MGDGRWEMSELSQTLKEREWLEYLYIVVSLEIVVRLGRVSVEE